MVSMLERSQVHKLITSKISGNGFSEIDINLETDLLSSGYLDSLDVAEILYYIEQMSDGNFRIPPKFHSEKILFHIN